jgi:hypothetical protein
MTTFDSIEALFSPPDPSVSQEGSVDPMGLLVIWQEHARRIFERKLNSVATDARALVINVLHHSAVQAWLEAHPGHDGWEGRFDCHAGMLIWSEDLLAHAFLELEQMGNSVEAMGILGLSKLKGVLATQKKHDLIPLMNRGVLKNQLALGYTGRYKAAMIEMGFFDVQFARSPENEAVWAQIERLIHGTPPFKRYRDSVRALLEVADPGAVQHYPILPAELRGEHVQAVEAAFGTTLVPEAWRLFLRKQLGLEDGAAGGIAHEVRGLLDAGQTIDPEAVLHRTVGRVEPSEQQKLRDILWLEPVLAHVDWFFDHLLASNGKPVEDLEGPAQRVRNFIASQRGLGTSIHIPRLEQLWAMLIASGTHRDWIEGFVQFHQKTMDERRGITWVSIGPSGLVKQQYMRAGKAPDEAGEVKWRRSYYVHSVESMMRVLR